MKRACLVLALAALARPCAASVPAASLAPAPRETMSRAQPATGAELTSRLAPVTFRGSAEVPELWLAQRAIDREWGPSDDSTYRTVDVKGWKSEGLALALSSAVPGAGQIYTGEGSGWLYVVGEALGWAGRVITHHRGVQLRDQPRPGRSRATRARAAARRRSSSSCGRATATRTTRRSPTIRSIARASRVPTPAARSNRIATCGSRRRIGCGSRGSSRWRCG